jgi:chromosome partitioning protein
MAANLVVIPVQPSPYDVWAVKEIVDLLREARVFKEALAARFVINRKIVKTAIGRDVVEALSGYEIPIFSSHVCQRVSFAESAASGSAVSEVAPGGPASREVKALTEEILSMRTMERAA